MQASKPQRRPVRRARGSLTLDAIVETAFALAADSSIDELSIPLVAKSLDVGVTSIYWHVRNKSELLDAMTDRVLRRTGFPPFVESDDWRASLMTHVRGVRQTFLGNPVLTDLILIRGALSPVGPPAGRAGDGEGDRQHDRSRSRRADGPRHVLGGIGTRPGVGTSRKVGAEASCGARDGVRRWDGFADAALPQDNRAFELLLTSVLTNVALRAR